MSEQTIYVTSDAVNYTWDTTVTAKAGQDISTDPVYISLGTYEAAGTWLDSSDLRVALTRPTDESATINLLVGAETTPGDYYVWVKVTDNPEVEAERGARIHVR